MRGMFTAAAVCALIATQANALRRQRSAWPVPVTIPWGGPAAPSGGRT
jgi:hypothetical protein